MREQDPYVLGTRTIPEWHHHLTTSPDGIPEGHLACPGSRYGSTSDEAAWFAIGLAAVYANANGVDEEFEGTVDRCMSLCVNDSPEPAELILDHWFAMPRELKEQIGRKKDVRRLLKW